MDALTIAVMAQQQPTAAIYDNSVCRFWCARCALIVVEGNLDTGLADRWASRVEGVANTHHHKCNNCLCLLTDWPD